MNADPTITWNRFTNILFLGFYVTQIRPNNLENYLAPSVTGCKQNNKNGNLIIAITLIDLAKISAFTKCESIPFVTTVSTRKNVA